MAKIVYIAWSWSHVGRVESLDPRCPSLVKGIPGSQSQFCGRSRGIMRPDKDEDEEEEEWLEAKSKGEP